MKAEKTYLFGNVALIEDYIAEAKALPRITIFNLFSITAEDLVVTSRAWSILFEFWLFFAPRRRPYLVQVADGLVFDRNRNKNLNRRYGYLYKYVFADLLLIRQNLPDADSFSEDIELIRSVRFVSCSDELVKLSKPAAILVAGNDAQLNLSARDAISAFHSGAARLRNIGISDIKLSCPNRSLQRAICKANPDVNPIGKLSKHVWDRRNTILLGSPSTVLYDNQIAGGYSLLLRNYSGKDIERYFTLDTSLDSAFFDKSGVQLTVRRFKKIENRGPLNMQEVFGSIGKKRQLSLRRRSFFRNFSIRLFLREIHLLLAR